MTAGEVNDDGDGFRYPVVVVSVPRRAGKSTLTLGAGLASLDRAPDVRSWFTANRRETAAKLFRDEWVPMLARQSDRYRLRRSQGSEGVHKRRGSSRLQLFAPNADGLHSTNADTVIIDEAWAFDVEQGEDIEAGARFAQLTRPWRQTWIVSAGGTLESAWFDRWLCAGEADTPGVALFDWGADPHADGYDPSDPAVWLAGHPTAGRAFPLDVIAHEWNTRTDDAAFERAILNVWPRPSQVVAQAGVDLAAWRAAARPAMDGRPVALALDVARDRSAAAIAQCAVTDDGRYVVSVLQHEPGLQWVADAAKRARARGLPIVADSIVAASIVAELNRAGVTVDVVGAADHARACGMFVDRLALDLYHRAQAGLDDAMLHAARRPLGDGWLWSRSRSGADICPLVAVTLAHWAGRTRGPTGRGSVAVPDAALRHDANRPGPSVRTLATSRGRFAPLRGVQRPIR